MCSLDDAGSDIAPADAKGVLDIEPAPDGGTGDAERAGMSEGAATDKFALLSRSRSR